MNGCGEPLVRACVSDRVVKVELTGGAKGVKGFGLNGSLETFSRS